VKERRREGEIMADEIEKSGRVLSLYMYTTSLSRAGR
jgi:hypothetical protein